MFIIPALRKLKPEEFKFENSLGYKLRMSQKKKKSKANKMTSLGEKYNSVVGYMPGIKERP